MLKLKTCKSLLKRIKITKNRKYLSKHSSKNHLLYKKSKKNKRALSTLLLIKKNYISKIKILLKI
uniref:50S ribosomal protein L35 n=1 Tax=Nitzschia sp. IriIs04 TaxID=1444690 RepID=A0A0S3QPL0_9STRA|nr:ribosomal protein L35 [Nitzschia sp. IriIs04]BAT70276.1 ribosomal protein L35 [Nitzschia sp. IriIs04]